MCECIANRWITVIQRFDPRERESNERAERGRERERAEGERELREEESAERERE